MRTVQDHRGPIVVLIPYRMQDFAKKLPLIGLLADLGACHTVHSNIDESLGHPVLACPAERARIDLP